MQGDVVMALSRAAQVFFRVLVIVMCIVGFFTAIAVTNGWVLVVLSFAFLVWYLYDLLWG